MIALLLGMTLGVANAQEEVLRELENIPDAPGTSAWDRAVTFHLLVGYDQNGSASLDRPREVKAVPCGVWTWIDEALARRSEYPGLVATYGFPDDLVWLGHFLGFDERVRRVALRRFEQCGLTPSGPGVGVSDPAIDEMVTGMMLGIPDPGTDLWVTRTRVVLTLTYDEDESSVLDTAREVRAVPCAVWRILDDRLFEAQRSGLVQTFGLRPDLPFQGDRLGLVPGMAEDAYETARRCGLHDAGRR